MKILIILLTFISLAAFANESEHHEVLYPTHEADRALATEPEKVVLNEPSYMQKISEETITLKWSPSATADAYFVQVATDPNFKWLVKEDHNVNGTELTLTGLTKNQNYFWRVAAVKSNNKAGNTKSAFTMNSFRKL